MALLRELGKVSVGVCVSVCVGACLLACVRAYVHAWVYACVGVCVGVCVVCLRAGTCVRRNAVQHSTVLGYSTGAQYWGTQSQVTVLKQSTREQNMALISY